ncbi:peptidase M56 family protein [Arthrobacter celericrescens]|uniref:peptidase M56 family protein n=1 Tax=Arthrobacter celericrescens TaxID=2320851 RepID=UPI000EA351E2|nr:peptidase M56 family protein [Arthrobacter celericrescens]
MSPLLVDDGFSNALRQELVSSVRKQSPARTRRRARLWLGAGVLAGTGLLGGIGATASGLLAIPGGERITPLAAPVTETYAGTATIELGTPPEGTTGIHLELVCLTPGRFEFEDGASVECWQADVDRREKDGGWNGQYTMDLAPGRHSVTIKTEPTSRWQLSVKYVKQEVTDWATNAKGETYGAENMENGVPDLIAVVATNGKSGYVYRVDLEEANGTAAIKTFKSPADALAWQAARGNKDIAIPVYDLDGKTVLGEFVISGRQGHSGERPTEMPSGRATTSN